MRQQEQFKYSHTLAFPAINPDTCVFMATRKGYKHSTARTPSLHPNKIYKDSEKMDYIDQRPHVFFVEPAIAAD